uniref:DUF4219 domain-containing protein n=1 Tax=Musca domestica TaxID=7370 RepID=A0A1I8NJG4_MUSDO
MASALSFPFDKLRGRENFDTWKRQAKSYLILKNSWKIIENGLAVDANEKDKENNEKALAEITLMVEPCNFAHIAKAKSAKKAWQALVSSYEDTGLTRKVELLKQLVQLKLSDCDNVDDYVNRMLMASMKVQQAGLKIDDELVASLMLAGLPEEFKSLVLAVENSKTQLNVDMVKNLLLQDAKFDGIKKEDAAFIAKKKFIKVEVIDDNEKEVCVEEPQHDGAAEVVENADVSIDSMKVEFDEWSDDNVLFEDAEQELHNDNNDTEIRRSGRLAAKSRANYSFCAATFIANDPTTLEEAMKPNNVKEWRSAMDEEIISLAHNKTWELVDLPNGRKPLKSE